MKKKLVLILTLVMLLSPACSSQNQALNQAKDIASNREYYVPHNDVEARNYNWRLEIADDPSLILWCTFFPTNPNAPIITVPIMGKLTSGGKRPFPSVDCPEGCENPGADGMYGSSGDYRYGFGPGGKHEYYDFYGTETFCTTMPLVYQREETIIVMEKDPTLMEASDQAKAALEAGNSEEAEKILIEAIQQVQGGR